MRKEISSEGTAIRALSWCIPAAGFVALLAAGVLSLGHLLGVDVPCGRDGGCQTVAAHPSSVFSGVPLALIGATGCILLLASFAWSERSRLARNLFVYSAFTGAVASVALVAFSHFGIGVLCAWCLVSGGAWVFLGAGGLILARQRAGFSRFRRGWFWTLAVATAAALGAEAGSMRKAADVPPVPPAVFATVPRDAWRKGGQSIGRHDAPVVVTMFTDFWCPACRTLHQDLVGYQNSNPSGLRLVIRHFPLAPASGHGLSTATAVFAEIAGEGGRFDEFAHAVMASPRRMSSEECVGLMERLGFDSGEVRKRIADPDDPAVIRVRDDVRFAERLGIHSTPVLIVEAAGMPLVSASSRTLPTILNRPEIRRLLEAVK